MSAPLLKPRRLVPGDLLGVAALSGPVDPGALDRGCAALAGMGYRVRVAGNAGLRSGALGLAGTDDERLEGYRDLLSDPEVRGILLARGGYGITRILPRLDPEEVSRDPRVHCGFSDATALHAFLLTRCGIPSFHGPMVAADLSRDLDPLVSRYFPSMLEGRGPGQVEAPNADVLVPGTASGRLVGGCLSLLAALVGTPEEFDTDGAILFLEDVAEEAYRVDRMLGTLERAGRFAKLAGVLIGNLSGITFGGAEDAPRLRALLVERLGGLGVPVAFGLPFGHRGPNVPLPVGGRVTWDGERRTLRLEEEIVA